MGWKNAKNREWRVMPCQVVGEGHVNRHQKDYENARKKEGDSSGEVRSATEIRTSQEKLRALS